MSWCECFGCVCFGYIFVANAALSSISASNNPQRWHCKPHLFNSITVTPEYYSQNMRITLLCLPTTSDREVSTFWFVRLIYNVLVVSPETQTEYTMSQQKSIHYHNIRRNIIILLKHFPMVALISLSHIFQFVNTCLYMSFLTYSGLHMSLMGWTCSWDDTTFVPRKILLFQNWKTTPLSLPLSLYLPPFPFCGSSQPSN